MESSTSDLEDGSAPPAEDADVPAADTAAAEPPRSVIIRRGVPWTLFVLALATALAFGWLWHQARGENAEQAQVKDVATKFLQALTNFKAQSIDADVARIKSYAVGDFADQASQVFGQNFFQQAKEAKVQSTGTVRSVFVQSISGGNAEVFGVVDEVFRNATSGPTTEVVRFDVTMIDTKDGWKVENVQLLQSPGPTPFGT